MDVGKTGRGKREKEMDRTPKEETKSGMKSCGKLNSIP